MFENIAQVKKAHKAIGGHFFDREAMRFFNSKVESDVYAGRYFVTSERRELDMPKRFTVRQVAPSGEMLEDLFGFQVFVSLELALVMLGIELGK
jgi:hypothetical protein